MAAQPVETSADREVLEAARLLLSRMGVDPADLLHAAANRPAVPTFRAYIPIVSAAVSAGTRATYGSYWQRLEAKWGERTLLEPTPSEILQFAEQLKANVVVRRNSRGGRGTVENFLAALRCLYRHAEDDGLITSAENPARKSMRWQPVSPTLMTHLLAHAEERGADDPNGPLLRYPHGEPITSRRYDHLWGRIGRYLPWVATQNVSTHWLRH